MFLHKIRYRNPGRYRLLQEGRCNAGGGEETRVAVCGASADIKTDGDPPRYFALTQL